MWKQQHKVNTTAIRVPPKDLGDIEDLQPAKDVFWVLMPLHKSGPYGKECVSPGDFSMHGTTDKYFANLFNILATVCEEKKDGGWLLKVSRENDKVWNRVIEGIAKIEMGEVDQNLIKWVKDRAYQGRFFDSTVTDAVQKAKERLAREKEAKRKRRSKNSGTEEIM